MKLLIVLAGLLGIAMAMPTEQSQEGNLIPVEMVRRQDSTPCGNGACARGFTCVEVTNICISAEVPETIGSRAQQDFLVACRTIDLEDAGNAPYEILAVTRDAQSSSPKKLFTKFPDIKLITGNLDAIDQPVGKNEESQGKALIDVFLKHSISHFVYTSVDRGTNSDTDATNIPHFITEYDIEQHLFFCVAEKSNMAYTVLRPVGFYDNVTADFFCKVFTTSWAVKLPEDKKLQLIATSDNGIRACRWRLQRCRLRSFRASLRRRRGKNCR
ncbi:hypothetical protein P3342_007888 [Pyrenophora teres f. teres]|nr:hypothetical protein P3342_007888 [Pyrenophora teres f. teres]